MFIKVRMNQFGCFLSAKVVITEVYFSFRKLPDLNFPIIGLYYVSIKPVTT